MSFECFTVSHRYAVIKCKRRTSHSKPKQPHILQPWKTPLTTLTTVQTIIFILCFIVLTPYTNNSDNSTNLWRISQHSFYNILKSSQRVFNMESNAIGRLCKSQLTDFDCEGDLQSTLITSCLHTLASVLMSENPLRAGWWLAWLSKSWANLSLWTKWTSEWYQLPAIQCSYTICYIVHV